MNVENLEVLQEALARLKENDPNDWSVRCLETRLEELKAESAEETMEEAEADVDDRLEALETETMRMHNHLLTLRDRLEQLETQAEAVCVPDSPETECVPEIKISPQREDARMKGFLAGLSLAWLAAALGVFIILAGWKTLCWSAELLGLTAPVLLSLLLLFALALLLQKRAKAVTAWFLKLLDTKST